MRTVKAPSSRRLPVPIIAAAARPGDSGTTISEPRRLDGNPPRLYNVTLVSLLWKGGPMPPPVERLDHWTLVTTDVARAKRFYTEVFGATPIDREWPPSVVFGGTIID